MSLLRRIERAGQDLSGGAPGNRPPSPPRQSSSPIHELWHHVADGKLFTVTMTRDSRFIIAGSQAGEILFFDIAGRLLWKGNVAGAVNRLALAEDAECFLVGTISSGDGAYLWHYTGRLLRTFASQGDTKGIGITPDANLIVIGSQDRHLVGFDRDGALRFDQVVDHAILNLAITAAGDMIFAGSDDHHVIAYDPAGNQRWTYQTDGSIWAGIRIAEQGRVLVAGSNDHCVYCLGFDGQERWKFDTGGSVNTLSVTPDGTLTAAAGQSNTVYVLNEDGNVLWEYQTGDHVYGLDLSPDGRFLVIGSNDSNLYLVDRKDTPRVWKHVTRGRVYGVALAPNGQYFAAASADQNVYAFRNTQVEEAADVLTRPDSKPLMRLIVQRVYEEYASAPHAGLVRWFSEFEKSLRNHQFDACQALLRAAHEERGFELSDGEKQYIHSLEGVYWLVRGVAFHRHGQYEEARACYEKSKTLQESLNNQDGAGQVVAALSLLPPRSEAAQDDPDGETPQDTGLSDECRELLDEITNKPRVLGMSEKLLAQRLCTVPTAEQLQIILLAKQFGYVAPLIKGLSADERVIQAAASAGLALLDPGPGYDILGQMLESPLLFVKWQALRILRDRASQHADQFKGAKAQFWPIVISPTITEAPDPLTRREAALLAKDGGDDSDTPWLIERLGDPDPDVQIAVAEALGAVGDRRALPKLARLPNKSGFLGHDLGTAAADARNAIETRHPTPTIEQVILCSADPLQWESVQESTLFLTGTDTIYSIVTVDHVKPGAQVTIKWLDGDTVVKEDQATIPEEPDTQRIAEIREMEFAEETPQLVPRRRSPFNRDNGEESARFGSFRRRSPFAQNDEEDDDNPFTTSPRRRSPLERTLDAARPGPFQRRETIEPPQRPSFLRDRPGFPPPRENVPRPRPFGERGRFGGTETDQPGTRAPLGSRPRSPFGQREPAPASRPGAAPRGLPRVTDPNENIVTEHTPAETNNGGNEQPASSARSRPSFPSRSGGGRPGAPRPGASQEAELPPGLRHRDDQDNDAVPNFLRANPFERSAPERGPLGRFGRPDNSDRPFPARAPRLGPSPTAQQLVFSLPCPTGGWKSDAYQIEVELDEATAKHQTPFQFIETIKITGLEPGVAAQPSDSFGKTSIFLVGTQYVDCLAHLEEAPVNTCVTGRATSVTTGTLVAETVAYTQKQGHQSVQLSWENTVWQPGHYRLVATVENGNELSADIEVVTKIRADHIILCHQVDKNNGPVGANWPFRPGDQCYCVVEFNAPPPGVEVIAAWYRKNGSVPVVQTRPYVTTAAPDQRSVFRFTSEDRNASLTPGHYSVVVEGKNLVREERTFEVLPYSRAQVIQRATQNAYQKVSPLIQKYHLTQMALSLGLTALLVLALWLVDVGLGHTLSANQRSGDVILRLAHTISRPSVEWGLGWLAFGGVYAALHTRHVKKMGQAVESPIYSTVNLLIVFASGALVWYLASTIAFGAGHLWPDKLWGLFDKLLWLNPVVAWFAPMIGLGLVEWQRQEDEKKPFHLSPIRATLGVMGLMLIGWGGALIIGLPAGVLGGGIGGIVDAVGLDNRLRDGFLTVGAGTGFILAVIAVGPYAIREDLVALWKEWLQKKQQDSGPRPNMLNFLIGEEVLPGKPRDFLLAAAVARRGLMVIGVTLAVLLIVFRPVVMPVLEFFYGAPNNPAFEDTVMSSKWAAAAAMALLIAWPVLVLSVYRRILSPLLSANDAAFVRRASIAAAALAGLVPASILLTGRALMGSAPNADVGLFWTNHAASLGLLMGFGVWLAVLIWKLPDSLRAFFEFDFSGEERVVVGIALLAGLLVPGWMWALLLVVTMIMASSAVLLQRVE